MKNNKGFTLIELIAVIAVLAIILVIAIPSVSGYITNSKDNSYKLLVSNIKTGAMNYYIECENNPTDNLSCSISSNTITTTLGNLVSNGFITGNDGKITNPKTNQDISNCSIIITKNMSTDYKVTYTVTNNTTSNKNCPSY